MEEYVPKVENGFMWADYVVFVAVLLISLSFGVYYLIIDKIRGQSATGFLGGKRDLSILPTTFSILSGFVSAVLIAGNAAEIYLQGTLFVMMTFGMILGCLITIRFFVPLFYPLGLTSTNQVCNFIINFFLYNISVGWE